MSPTTDVGASNTLMSISSPLRVLVVDDNESVRRSVRQLLNAEPDIQIVSEAVDGGDAIRKAREHTPDLVLMDITMPTMNGLEATQIIKQEIPSIQIVMFSQHDSRGFQWAALAAGASGYVVKADASRDLVPQVRRVQKTASLPLTSFDHWSAKK
jgi:DNA-binding NarL/FixJ family response regulator